MIDDQTIDAPTTDVSAKRANAVPLESGAACSVSKSGENESSMGSTAPHNPSITALLPIMGVVLVAFLVIGLALPVLPLHVHQGLGLSTFVVGLVTGSQFAASLISRVWSGHYADRRGAKRAVVLGLLTAVVAGLLYLLSLRFVGMPWLSVTILLFGRALLGGAESFVITGAVSWGLALAGPQNAGRVIAWVGMSMFAALAFGAPVGTTLYAIGGFIAVAAATILVPLITVLLVTPLRSVPAQRGAQAGLMKVLGAVWLPGFGSALSSVGFGAMIAFSSLLSAERGLSPLWLTFSAFAIALVAARLFLGHTPDKLGGAKVALVCVFIEAGGLALIWFASNPVLAAAGAALTGFGYSLVYPGLGVEAVRRAPPQSRGLAMGAYTVFLDVALGFSSPALGLIAGWTGLGSVFLASAILVLCAAVIAAWLLRKNSLKEKQSWGADYPPAKRNGKMGIPGVQRRQIGEQQRKSRPLLLLPQGAGPAGFCLHVGPDEDRELARQPFTKPGGSNEIHRRNTRNAVHACLGFGTGRSDQDARGRSHGCSRA